jgi:hypothetical protein
VLIIIAVGGLGAFIVGMIMLYLYARGNNRAAGSHQPVVYGNLIQCPNCGHMNPLDAQACLRCRMPLPHAPMPSYNPDYPGMTVPAPVQPAYQPPRMTPPPIPQVTQPQQAPSAVVPQYPPSSATYTPPMPDATPLAPLAPPIANQPMPPAAPASTEMPTAWLEGVGGSLMGHRIVINQSDMLIGRSTSCDIQVYDPKVSRKHFLIRFGNGAFFAQDQQSSRGTWINGQRINAQRLKDGDHIEVGDSEMVFHCQP